MKKLMLIPRPLQREMMAILWGIVALLSVGIYIEKPEWWAFLAAGILFGIIATLYIFAAIRKNKEEYNGHRCKPITEKKDQQSNHSDDSD